jgi:putative endonuclease
MRSKTFAVYLLTNKNNTVLYTGVTNDLRRRISEHRLKLLPGFTKQYNVDKLVYFEWFEDAPNAITREKQIKAGSRKKKVALIEASNPEWRDLFELLLE